MKKQIIAFSAAIFMLFMLINNQGCGTDDAYSGTAVGVVAPSFWFAGSSTPAPSDVEPFNQPDVSDTSFHLWAWQKFLSITRSSGAKAPFENYVQVDNFMNKVSDTVFLSDSSQAGTHGVLYDKQGHAILYTIHVNQQMYDFSQNYLPQFKAVLQKYAGMSRQTDSTQHDQLVQHALDSLHLDTLNYPVGCVELKTSWIYADDLGPDSVNYYLTNAIVETTAPLYSTTQPVQYVIQKSVRRMAMLSMHIIGRVANHPEFIWATYEHDELAPDYIWGNTWPQDTVNVIPSQKDFLFYTGGTKVKDCPMKNNSQTPPGFKSIYNMFPLGIARSFYSNSLPTAIDSSNNANILSLNASVHAQLEQVGGPWKHYFYKGSVWLKYPNTSYKPGQGNLGFLGNPYLRGSRALSDITMETFGQVDYSGEFFTGSMNCFGCHGTVDYVNVWSGSDSLSYNLALSHLFKNALGVPSPDVVSPDSCRNCNVAPHKR